MKRTLKCATQQKLNKELKLTTKNNFYDQSFANNLVNISASF
jgi:hypothetical protein